MDQFLETSEFAKTHMELQNDEKQLGEPTRGFRDAPLLHADQQLAHDFLLLAQRQS